MLIFIKSSRKAKTFKAGRGKLKKKEADAQLNNQNIISMSAEFFGKQSILNPSTLSFCSCTAILGINELHESISPFYYSLSINFLHLYLIFNQSPFTAYFSAAVIFVYVDADFVGNRFSFFDSGFLN